MKLDPTNLRIIDSIDNDLHHVSLSRPHRLPTWEEIKWVRDKYCKPDSFYAVVLPPERYYVNFHKYCMHLWEVKSKHEVETWMEM